MVQHAVEDSGSDHLVAEDVAPLRDGLIRGDEHAASLRGDAVAQIALHAVYGDPSSRAIRFLPQPSARSARRCVTISGSTIGTTSVVFSFSAVRSVATLQSGGISFSGATGSVYVAPDSAKATSEKQAGMCPRGPERASRRTRGGAVAPMDGHRPSRITELGRPQDRQRVPTSEGSSKIVSHFLFRKSGVRMRLTRSASDIARVSSNAT